MFSYDIIKDLMNINEAGFSCCHLAMHMKFQITISNHYIPATNKDNFIRFVVFSSL